VLAVVATTNVVVNVKNVVDLQWFPFNLHLHPKCRCSSPFGNLVSCSLLISSLYSLNHLFCGDVICGTSYLYSLSCLSCGDVICGTFTVYLATYTTIGTKDGSTLPVIILCAFPSMISRSFIPKPKAPLSSTLFFLLRALLKNYVAAFFLFSNVVYTSSLVLKPWLVVSMDLPFDAQADIERFLPIPRKIDRYLSYPLYFL
jgi:hypothetical protein